MRKVGVDGGAANGSTGGTKRSAPGHGPTKNRSPRKLFLKPNLTKKNSFQSGVHWTKKIVSKTEFWSKKLF